jgi:fructose-bisphosphate aldolase class II
MLSNMAVSILDKERITTTLPKAKEVRRVVERLITYGKMGNLHGIRLAERRIKNKTILKKLFDDIAPGYKGREGGYTRIIKLGERVGDNAPVSIIELTGRGTSDAVRKGKKKSRAKKSQSTGRIRGKGTYMAVSYRELGFVNTRGMFQKAFKGNYAIPAYNFNNMEQIQAIITACGKSKSPVIMQVSSGARKYANSILLRYMAQGAVAMARDAGYTMPVALHLDHGDTFELCVSCIESGFSSVMIDGSHHPYDTNVELTAKVVEYAHKNDVTVEGELGVLSGIEDDVVAAKSIYTQPDQVEDFVKKTGVDSLAISIGTSHGAYKFKPEQCTRNEQGVLVPPPLRFDILEEIEKRIPGFPIVLHGASSVVPEYVNIINTNGGKLKAAVGIPAEQLRRAAKSAVCKINIDSDGRLVLTAMVRKVLAEQPQEFDPRKYLGPAREELVKMMIDKNENVLGSAGKA